MQVLRSRLTRFLRRRNIGRFPWARALWRRLIRFFRIALIHGGSLDWIVLDRKGSIKSIPVWTIFSRADTFSAQELTALMWALTSTSWRYVRMAWRVPGRRSLDLTVNRGFGTSARGLSSIVVWSGKPKGGRLFGALQESWRLVRKAQPLQGRSF